MCFPKGNSARGFYKVLSETESSYGVSRKGTFLTPCVSAWGRVLAADFPVCFPDGPPGNAALPPHGDAPHGSETPQHAPCAPRDDASDDAPHGRTPDGPGKAIPASSHSQEDARGSRSWEKERAIIQGILSRPG